MVSHGKEDKELFESIEKGGFVEKLESDPSWKILREIADKIVEKAVIEFAVKTKPDDVVRIIQLQTIIKKYKFAFFDEIQRYKDDADMAYIEVQERGTFGDFIASVKEKVGL